MTTDAFFSAETPFQEKHLESMCSACKGLYLEAEELIRKTEAADACAEAFRQKTLELEAERKRLLDLLFSSKLEEA